MTKGDKITIFILLIVLVIVLVINNNDTKKAIDECVKAGNSYNYCELKLG